MMTYRVECMDLRSMECHVEFFHAERQAFARYEAMLESKGDWSALFVIDSKGVILISNIEPDDEEEDYEPSWNEDEGFDPYMGCYTEDC